MTRHNLDWDVIFRALEAFKGEHGHCHVPTLWEKNPLLGRWVAVQRYRHKIGELQEPYVDRLNQIGFVWAPADRTNRMAPVVPQITKGLEGFADSSGAAVHSDSPRFLIDHFDQAIASSKWDVIYFTLGYDGIKDVSEATLKKFDRDMAVILEKFKPTGARIMWGSQSSLPTKSAGGLTREQIKTLNGHAMAILEANSVLVNDFGFFNEFTPTLVKSIVESAKFFGN